MHTLYQAFVEGDPGTSAFKGEVERLQQIEQDVLAIPDRLDVGSVSLNTAPIKDSLHGFSVAWKMRYSTQIHEDAKVGCLGYRGIGFSAVRSLRFFESVVLSDKMTNSGSVFVARLHVP